MPGNPDLSSQILTLMPTAGAIKTEIANLTLIRGDDTMDNRIPVVYDPCVYVVVQGQKVAFLGNETYIYDALNYLVLSVPLPLECQIIEASKEKPYLAVKIDINTQMLNELIQEFDSEQPSEASSQRRGIFVSGLSNDIKGSVERLLSYVNKPSAAKVLAPLAIKELLFHILMGAQGEQLKIFAYRDRHNYQIVAVINFIKSNYSNNLEVSELASKANMSQSSFHQYFKAITNFSPIQYIKFIRLHEARRKMLYDNQSASDAAYHVGYASPSQFSREYRRLFGISPSIDIQASLTT